jgi:hypothetical protein
MRANKLVLSQHMKSGIFKDPSKMQMNLQVPQMVIHSKKVEVFPGLSKPLMTSSNSKKIEIIKSKQPSSAPNTKPPMKKKIAIVNSDKIKIL